MKSITSIAVGVVVAAGLAQTCLYTVGEREYAMLFALGELKTVVTEPGLHFKLPAPLQNVVYLDKRVRCRSRADEREEEPDDRHVRQVAHR